MKHKDGTTDNRSTIHAKQASMWKTCIKSMWMLSKACIKHTDGVWLALEQDQSMECWLKLDQWGRFQSIIIINIIMYIKYMVYMKYTMYFMYMWEAWENSHKGQVP